MAGLAGGLGVNLSIDKTRARLQAKKVRASAHDDAAAFELISRFPIQRFRGAVIGGFWPIQSEIDPRPLMEALERQGHRLTLPCTPRKGKPLTFRSWQFGEKLKIGPHNTREPFPNNSEMFPDLVLVPLLAFTHQGMRLGYGGGFYDRTLERLRKIKEEQKKQVFACGVAYSAQEASSLPTESHDAKLDGMLTETYFKEFE